MKDWKLLEPDLYKLMNKHYSPGRDRKIDKIVVHYNAGVGLSTADVWSIWQSREASAHYQVETSGRIGQLVRDKDTAWHAGDWATNSSSIGIEHANNSSSFGFSKETLEEGAHLVAALCVGYGLGRPQWGKNVFPHSQFTSTSCPGELQRSLRDSYMARAGYWYDTMTGRKPAPAPAPAAPSSKPPKLDVDEYLGPDTQKAWARINGTTADGVISSQDESWRGQYGDRITCAEWVSSAAAEGSSLIGRVQGAFRDAGLYHGDVDGLIGPQFIAAFVAYYGGGTLAKAVGNLQRAINRQNGY